MVDFRTLSFGIITSVYLFGTLYSLYASTYLDTSNPYITHLPHHLQETHYFASKTNWLNVIFVKRAWGWTTAAFFALYFTSPQRKQTKERLFKWIVATGFFVVFASWFFGPAVIDRFAALSGGECVVALPGPTGAYMTVPMRYCIDKSVLSPSSHPSLFPSPLFTPKDAAWAAIPRLRRGHDVSGHAFLVTMSFLFLSDQIRTALSSSSFASISVYHQISIALNLALMALWILASYATALYFHTPLEKLTGYLLGLAGFGLTQLSVFEGETQKSAQPTPEVKNLSVKDAAKRQD